jgi:hypothetical protein
VRLRPIPAAPELPAVDDVADQIQMVGIVVPQKIQQIFDLAAGRSQVDVGDPDRTIPVRAGSGRSAGNQTVSRCAIMGRIESRACDNDIARIALCADSSGQR